MKDPLQNTAASQATDEVQMVKAAYERAKENQTEAHERLYKYYGAYRAAEQQAEVPVVTRSKYVVPLIFKAVETILPRIMSVIFSTNPPVQSRYRIKPTFDTAAELKLRLQDQVFEYLYDREDLFEVVQGWFKEALIYGQAYLKIGWRNRVREYKERETGTGEVREVKQTVEDMVDVQRVDQFSLFFSEDAVFPDPFGTAKYVIHKTRKRRSHLMALKEAGIYGPQGGGWDFAEEDLPQSLENEVQDRRSSEIDRATGTRPEEDDPFVEVYEYWEDERVIVTAGHQTLLRDEPNPFGLPGHARKKPFVACYDTLVPGELFQIGEAEPLFHTQVEMTTLRRQRTDYNNVAINGGIFYDKDSDIDLESWGLSRPGMAVGVRTFGNRSIADAVMEMRRQPTIGTSYREYDDLDKDGQEISGLLDYAVGGSPERRETATTVQLLQNAANLRFDIKIRNFAQAFLRLNYMIAERLKQFLTKPIPLRFPLPGSLQMQYQQVTNNSLPNLDEIDLVAPGNPGLLLKDARQQRLMQFYEAMRQNQFANPQAALNMLIIALKEADIDGIEPVLQMLEQPVMPMAPGGGEGEGAGLPLPSAPTPPGPGAPPGPVQETQLNESPITLPMPAPSR